MVKYDWEPTEKSYGISEAIMNIDNDVVDEMWKDKKGEYSRRSQLNDPRDYAAQKKNLIKALKQKGVLPIANNQRKSVEYNLTNENYHSAVAMLGSRLTPKKRAKVVKKKTTAKIKKKTK